MNEPPKQSNTDKPLEIKRGRVDSVSLYEVKENELDILENGEPTGIYLNFSIFLLSLAFSGILTLCTATFNNDLVKNSFLFVSIIGIIIGILLLILWWKGRKSVKNIIQKIRGRIPQETAQYNTPYTEAANPKE
jgi:hypothetical protein